MVVLASGLRRLVDNQIHNDQLNSGEVTSAGWSAEATSNLAALIAELQQVDMNSSLAELNATTMSDNNGGRILL